MLDFLFSGWGAFWMTLFMAVPFAVIFYYVIYRKSVVDPGPSATPRKELSRLEGIWLAVVFVVFVGVNLASLKYMPTIAAARAATSGQPLQEIDVTAKSWVYEISNRRIEAGHPVRFSGKSSDTQHGFAVYHPDGRMLFTMMLMPGLTRPTTLVHTFKEPGRYKVRCLEYCGIAHHAMLDELIVVESN
ncbi:cytochrome C oxidase subunit II [Pelomicrobium sp. G1]|uniref:cytochrome C oxidase subunit II n=1 Tax=unclassified Pelomicrobium TaxID=2815318 RepID=UPI003F777E82